MNRLLQILGGLGVIAFAVGVAIRVFDLGRILNASPTGWWRASIGLLTIGMLFVLIEILNETKKR